MVRRAENDTFILAQGKACESHWRLNNHEVDNNVDLPTMQRWHYIIHIRDYHFN